MHVWSSFQFLNVRGGGKGKGRGNWRCSSFDLGVDLEWVVSEDEWAFFYHGRKGKHES